MLPRRVGGPELLPNRLFGFLSRPDPQDQLLRCSMVLPFENGGVVGRELSVLLLDDAFVSE